jgi:ADP-heptose:LPS heptosyltransferase
VAHLAAFLGRPTAVLFASTDPRWTAPRGPHVRVLHDPPPCAPCFRRTCDRPDRYACMRRLDPESVAEALHELLRDAARPAGGTAAEARP